MIFLLQESRRFPNFWKPAYRSLADGHLSYEGGSRIKYIPVGEDVELNLGVASKVGVEPVLMEFGTEKYLFDRKGNIAGWDEVRTWKVEVNNTRDLDIEIEITRGFGMTYWEIATDDEYEKYDAEHVRFELKLKARSKREVVYTVTTYHGTRQEALND